MRYPHHQQILPLKNQVIPTDRDTTALLPLQDDLVNRITGEPVMRWEQCLDFNGTSDSVVVPLGDRLEGLTEVTFEYVAELTSQTGNVLYKDDCILVENQSTYHRIRLHINGSWKSQMYISDSSFKSGLNHVTVTYHTDRGVSVYLNGNHYESFTDAETGELNTQNADDDLEIGRRNGSQWYNGRIQMVRIWDKALAPSMIQQWLQREAPNTPNLVGQWVLNTDNPIIGDTTGNTDGLRDGCTLVNGDLVYSQRRLEGKFGNAIAVEPATYNYCRNGDFTRGDNGSYGWDITAGDGSSRAQGYDPDLGPYMHFDWQSGGRAYHWLVMNSNIGRGYAEAGATYTMSCWVRVQKVYDARIHIGHAAVRNEDGGSISDKRVDGNWDDGQWHRIEMTRTFEATHVSNDGTEDLDGLFEIHSGNMTDNPDCYISFDLTRIQIEQRDHATGFTSDERQAPCVEAPSTWINPDEGSIGCWVHLPAGGSWSRIVSFIPSNGNYAIDSHSDLQFDLNIGRDTVRLKASNKDGSERSEIGGALVAGWNYVACSWGANGLLIYANGVYNWDTSYTGGIAELHPEIAIGHELYDSNKTIGGSMQELRIDRIQRNERDFASWEAANGPFGLHNQKGG